MYFVSHEAAEAVLSMPEAIGTLQLAYAKPINQTNAPRRTIVQGERCGFRVLPAAPPGSRYLGAKLMGASMTTGTFRGMGYVIALFDREAGELAALVDAKYITGFRTAATSAAALDHLAPPGPVRLGVLGSGFEAAMHVNAFAAVRELAEVVVFSPTPEKRSAFARTVTDTLGVPARAAGNTEEASEFFRTSADVILCAARSRGEKPILFGDDVRPGVTVVSIGSTVPSQREIDPSVVDRCDLIVCDDVGEVVDETGDMIAATDAGLDFRNRCVSLHQLISGSADDLLDRSKTRMFKSVGSGVQDVAIAGLVLDKAITAGLVTVLPVSLSR